MKSNSKILFSAATLLLFLCSLNTAKAQCSVNAGNDTSVYLGYSPLGCVTLTAAATGTPPFTYLWSNGATTQAITVCDTVTTVYSVTVTDASACTSSDAVTVAVNDVRCGPHNNKVLVCHHPPGNPLNSHMLCVSAHAVHAHLAHGDFLGPCLPVVITCSVNLGPDTAFCSSQGSYLLDAGAGYVSYLWSNTSTTQTISVTQSGTYWVQVTNATNCTASDTVNVTVYPSPVANGGNDTTIVSPGCASLFGSATGGAPPYSFLWSTSETTQAISACPTVTTAYILNVTDTNGCSASDTVLVTVLSCNIDLGPDFAFCSSQGSYVLDAGTGYVSYLWSNSSTTQTISVTQSGTYWVQATNSSSCTASDTINITVNPTPSANAGNDTTIVPPGCASLFGSATGGTPPYSFSWSTSETTQAISACPTVTSTYILTVMDTNGCSSSDTVLVTVPCNVNLGPDTAFCSNEGVFTLNAGTGYVSYLWSDATTLQSITVNASGIYWVQVTDMVNCITSDTIVVTVHTSPVVNAGNDTTVTEPDCASLFGTVTGGTPPYSLLWSTAQTTQTVTICEAVPGTYIYTLSVIDSNGCTSIDSITVTFIPMMMIHLDPNPNSENARISFMLPEDGPASIELYDMAGNRIAVLFSSFAKENVNYAVDFSAGNLPGGIYLVRLVAGNGTSMNTRMVLIR